MGSPEIVRALALIVLFAVMSKGSQADEGPCKPAIAQLVSALGQVDTQFARRATWQPAVLNQDYCVEDRVRTGDLSRAVLAIMEGIATRLSLNQNTLVNFVTVADRAILSVEYGDVHVRSHTPRHFDVTTKFVNAGIEGTEFLVSTTDKQAEVTVFEGTVQLTNPHGRLTLKKGQSAIARTGQAPQIKLLLKPIDAVEWALYYPPIIDTGALLHSERQPALRHAVTLYQSGHIAEAFAALEPVPESERTGGEYLGFKAGLLLSAGQVEPAAALIHQALRDNPNQATGKSLLAMIALARNDKERALNLAQEATSLAPRSPVPLLALSYAEQARFDLPRAREAVEAALRLAPDNGLAHVRHAELLASLGERAKARQAAERAVALNPRLGRAHSVLGFTQLMEADTHTATQSFRHAIELDASDPLTHFGLGLARIRAGELLQGTEDLEIAGSLDPNNSLIRSYLGKAYYEQKRNELAETQFELAKQYDPKDPTPYFYDAIKKQSENRPVEALNDLSKSASLNRNRAIYRSQQLLDNDLAARGSAIGRIFNELGFSQRGLTFAWNGLNADPTDYTSHRLLSDSYIGLPRHEVARTSELLQSQLLQPVNITPIQPRLAESSLFLTGNLGPSALSMNEFNPLFNRSRFSTLLSGLAGSRDTYSDEAVHSGILDNFSYSLGQFHYQTRGFRLNNDIDTNIYTAFAQSAIFPELNIQAEFRHRDTDYGDLNSDFFSSINGPVSSLRITSVTDTTRFGFHLQPSQRLHLLGNYFHIEEKGTAGIGATATGDALTRRTNRGEFQFLAQTPWANLIGGLGLGSTERQLNIGPFGFSKPEQANAYLYGMIPMSDTLHWTIGGSGDLYRETFNQGTSRSFNPKIGLTWNLAENTVIRAAAIRMMSRSQQTPQTLEPTQVAGFNQFYEDTKGGVRSTRYGIGIDHKIDQTLSTGAEISERQLAVPNYVITGGATRDGTPDYDHWREIAYRGYLTWTPGDRWAASLEYFREDFSNLELAPNKSIPRNTRTQYIPITIAYFDPAGWFSRIRGTHYYQEVADFDLTGNGSYLYRQGHDNAILFDVSLGYRFPKRIGLIELQFQNLFNEHYIYESPVNRSSAGAFKDGVPQYLPFAPERTISARLTLSF